MLDEIHEHFWKFPALHTFNLEFEHFVFIFSGKWIQEFLQAKKVMWLFVYRSNLSLRQNLKEFRWIWLQLNKELRMWIRRFLQTDSSPNRKIIEITKVLFTVRFCDLSSDVILVFCYFHPSLLVGCFIFGLGFDWITNILTTALK